VTSREKEKKVSRKVNVKGAKKETTTQRPSRWDAPIRSISEKNNNVVVLKRELGKERGTQRRRVVARRGSAKGHRSRSKGKR